MGLFDFLKPTKKKPGDNPSDSAVNASANPEPDYPCQFGYKICWYAIKNETPQSIIEKLKLKVVRKSNWEEGIDSVYNSQKYMFVSPPLDGYVLVVNIYPDDKHDIV